MYCFLPIFVVFFVLAGLCLSPPRPLQTAVKNILTCYFVFTGIFAVLDSPQPLATPSPNVSSTSLSMSTSLRVAETKGDYWKPPPSGCDDLSPVSEYSAAPRLVTLASALVLLFS